jgi:phosphoglycerate dehydrogenase-like enzyme
VGPGFRREAERGCRVAAAPLRRLGWDARSGTEEAMGKKIVIVGAGAVGGYTGAHMAQAGEDVTFVDAWPENVEEIKKNGLRITHTRGRNRLWRGRALCI